MSDYYYYTYNGKKTYGGKRAKTPSADGYYGNNDAGEARHFKGSEARKWTFYKKGKGPWTVTATSFEEALRMVKPLGYSAADYKANKRGKK